MQAMTHATPPPLLSQTDCTALVIGSTGGIGEALLTRLSGDASFKSATGLSRSTAPAIDFSHPSSLERAANWVETQFGEINLLIIASGALTAPDGSPPEKAFSQLSGSSMEDIFRINAIGPALALKAFLPLMARRGLCRIGVLSARVGSIGDNQLGGWISYRASKAALNQIAHTAAIELSRKNKDSLCLALHPGTIETELSKPYASGRFTHSVDECAENLLNVLLSANPNQTGGFFDYAGREIVW